ncbi:MAG: undecaprenyl-diphosphate phosphatase [Candidatus Marsarchaeota archaeon]|nr:undecaprenyl-diphosphate phosphatase [Candidatus Marsarchaeota archaeon]
MFDLYQLLVSIVLGIVQGISEWLPVSSKTQILLVSDNLMHLTFQQAYAFGLFMEIGTILAAVIYFRRELLTLIRVLIGKGKGDESKLFKFVLISTIATGIIAVPIYVVVAKMSSGYNLGIPMMLLGMILFLDAALIKYSRSKYLVDKNRKTISHMGVRDYILVGLAQGLAALPGVSRSGATTSTLLLLNVEANEAFRLSFLDMIFATTAAVFVTLIFSKASVMTAVADVGITGLIISIIVATIISLFLIRFLLDIAKKSKVIYLIIALGLIAFIGGVALFMHPTAFSFG